MYQWIHESIIDMDKIQRGKPQDLVHYHGALKELADRTSKLMAGMEVQDAEQFKNLEDQLDYEFKKVCMTWLMSKAKKRG